jgi:tetratricopeptide (TPR) repeat protein
MKRFALFIIPLGFAIAIAQAQQAPASHGLASSQPAQEPAPENPNPPEMTPRQVAEMRADILVARKEYADAAQAYERILPQDPKSAELLNKIGMAYQQLGDTGRAIRYYKKAWSADKKFASAINNLGTVEYGRGHYGKAVKDYKKALEVSADMAGIYSNLGYAYCGDKQYPQAMTAFSRALALDPEVFEHHGGFGPLLQQRSAADPGALYFVMAQSFAKAGDAVHAANYLKLARDDGYKQYLSARNDPAFKLVIKDPRVQEVLRVRPPFEAQGRQVQD